MPSLIMIEDEGNDSFTKILHHFEGPGSTDFIDTAAGASATHTWSRTGTTIFSSAAGGFKFGARGLFQDASAANAFISTANSSDFTLGSGDWTLDFWINRSGDSTARGICGQLASDLSTGSIWVRALADGTVALNGLSTCQTTTSILGTSFHHIAYVRSGTSLFGFTDGNLDTTTSVSGSVGTGTTNWTIGREGDSASLANWAGVIDEFRLSVGIARWTAAFTPPAIAYSP